MPTWFGKFKQKLVLKLGWKCEEIWYYNANNMFTTEIETDHWSLKKYTLCKKGNLLEYIGIYIVGIIRSEYK